MAISNWLGVIDAHALRTFGANQFSFREDGYREALKMAPGGSLAAFVLVSCSLPLIRQSTAIARTELARRAYFKSLRKGKVGGAGFIFLAAFLHLYWSDRMVLSMSQKRFHNNQTEENLCQLIWFQNFKVGLCVTVSRRWSLILDL